jgi:hypothetical protein
VIELKKYLYRGTMERLAKKLVFADREGVSHSYNPDGAPYVTTTIGQEFFEPGDYLVSTLDGAVVRVYKAADFEPFAKEVDVAEPVQQEDARPDDGRNGSGDIHGSSKPGDGDGSVRVADGKAEAMGKTGLGRKRRAAQRLVGNHGGDEGEPFDKSEGSRKTHPRHRARKT